MARLNYYVAAFVAIGSMALDAFAFASRCSVSPDVNVPVLLLGIALQAGAVAFPVFFGEPYAGEISKRGLAIVGMSLLIFIAGWLVFRSSAQFSDAIGKPHYFRSAGLACRDTA